MENQTEKEFVAAMGSPWSDLEYALLQAGFAVGIAHDRSDGVSHGMAALARLGVNREDDVGLAPGWENDAQKICGVVLGLTCIALVRELPQQDRERLQANIGAYIGLQRSRMVRSRADYAAWTAGDYKELEELRQRRELLSGQRSQTIFGRLRDFFRI